MIEKILFQGGGSTVSIGLDSSVYGGYMIRVCCPFDNSYVMYRHRHGWSGWECEECKREFKPVGDPKEISPGWNKRVTGVEMSADEWASRWLGVEAHVEWID